MFQANPIHILKGHENYVNGLVFDPIGKYMATQSNQEKKVIIWKIHENFKKFTKEAEYTEPFNTNNTQAQFARLDWSPDGQLIATTSGCINGIFSAPLVKRGKSWNILGHLKGHRKSINICKFNP